MSLLSQRKLNRWQRICLPIVAGPLKGMQWAPGARGKILRVLLGSYEREQTRLFLQHIRPGDVVYDVGAASGYYTLLARKLVGAQGKVVAFEPNPWNASFLQLHVTANRFDDVELHSCAVGREDGTAKFAQRSGTGTGCVSADGTLQVAVRSLDSLVAETGTIPTHIKIDVEGAEQQLLEGARDLLQQTRPTLFLSTHGPRVHQACCQYLADLGYKLSPMAGGDLESAYEILCTPKAQSQSRSKQAA